jgi:hypothetical protein
MGAYLNAPHITSENTKQHAEIIRLGILEPYKILLKLNIICIIVKNIRHFVPSNNAKIQAYFSIFSYFSKIPRFFINYGGFFQLNTLCWDLSRIIIFMDTEEEPEQINNLIPDIIY